MSEQVEKKVDKDKVILLSYSIYNKEGKLRKVRSPQNRQQMKEEVGV